MKAKILHTEAEYREALAHVENLMDAEPGSPEEEELELFAVLIDQYEQEHYPIDLPDPVEAIKFRMEQEGLSRKDMRKYLGSQSKVSEILNRKRTLSLSMIRSLHEAWVSLLKCYYKIRAKSWTTANITTKIILFRKCTNAVILSRSTAPFISQGAS